MSLAGLLSQTVTIVRRADSGTTDAYGNPTDTTTTQNVSGLLQQRVRAEADQTVSETTWRLYLPTGTSISTDDAVRVGGKQYELVGDPWDAQEGSADMWHIEATVKRSVGGEGGT